MGTGTFLSLAAITLLAACGDDGSAGPSRDGGMDASTSTDAGEIDGPGGPDADASFDAGIELAPGDERAYEEVDGDVGGPERGFYRFVELTETTDLSWVAAGGHRLVFSYVRLDAYRDAPIDAALLADLERGLDEVRAQGLETILRFAYNDGPWPDSEPDAPLARVLAHIEQLGPILREHADVIALVQAGFIGAWGEWHTSTEGLLDDPADRRAILDALLDELPESRSTQLRYPAHKQEMFGDPLTAAAAWDGSDESRVGHHNDCFLSSATDVGTYPAGERETWLSYLEQDTRFVPMGGETCAVYPDLTDCEPAMAEMERLHLSFLNEDWHPDVVQAWRDQGCYEEIATRLGYRLVVREATLPYNVRPGGVFALEVTIENTGWAAPFNPRPAVLWMTPLSAPTEPLSAEIPGTDVRRWLAGETHTLSALVRLPADLPAPSQWQMHLVLPSTSPELARRVEYALPFANREVDLSGAFPLGIVLVDDRNLGGADPSQTDFVIESR